MTRFQVSYRDRAVPGEEGDTYRWDIAIEDEVVPVLDGFVLDARSRAGAGPLESVSIKFRFVGGIPTEYSTDQGITWHTPDEVRRDGELLERWGIQAQLYVGVEESVEAIPTVQIRMLVPCEEQFRWVSPRHAASLIDSGDAEACSSHDQHIIDTHAGSSPGLQKLKVTSTLVGERDGLLRQVEELNKELARMAERLRAAGLESPVEVVVRVSGRRLDL